MFKELGIAALGFFSVKLNQFPQPRLRLEILATPFAKYLRRRSQRCIMAVTLGLGESMSKGVVGFVDANERA
jgi:hypothetical protein